MLRLHAEVARRFGVSNLNHNDRFATWEDEDIGTPPIETVTSFTVRFGPFLSATVTTRTAWPDANPAYVEVRLWMVSPEKPEWFALITPTLREQLEALGFQEFGQWKTTLRLEPAAVRDIATLLERVRLLPIRLLRKEDFPPAVPWPGHGFGIDVAGATKVTVERSELKDGRRIHHVVLDLGASSRSYQLDDSGLEFVRWWEVQSLVNAGIPASSPLGEPQLAAALRSLPEPLAALDEDSRWFRFGAVRVSKSSALYSTGFPHPLIDGAHFESHRFEAEGRSGWVVVFVAAGAASDDIAGWVPQQDRDQVSTWIDRLNTEVLSRLGESRDSIAAGHVAQTLIFAQGSEYAPDDPVGAEILEISRDGALNYDWRRRGKVLRVVAGRVEPGRISKLHELLASTAFPAATPAAFPPGASICTLITTPPYKKMLIRREVGLETPEYGEILSALIGLCDALRRSNEQHLESWSFFSVLGNAQNFQERA